MGHSIIITRPSDPTVWSLVVATLVLLVTNAGVRRSGYRGRDMAVESKHQVCIV